MSNSKVGGEKGGLGILLFGVFPLGWAVFAVIAVIICFGFAVSGWAMADEPTVYNTRNPCAASDYHAKAKAAEVLKFRSEERGLATCMSMTRDYVTNAKKFPQISAEFAAYRECPFRPAAIAGRACSQARYELFRQSFGRPRS